MAITMHRRCWLAHCQDDATQKEAFYPVVSAYAFDNEEQVVNRANDSQYGLASLGMTKDGQWKHRVTSAAAHGCTWPIPISC